MSGTGSNVRRFPGNAGATGGSGFTPGSGGPYDPAMEARVALLERGFEELRASIARIEASQSELTKELRDLRRDLREVEIPSIKASVASIDASLKEKPTVANLIQIMVIIFVAAGLFTGANWWLAGGMNSRTASNPAVGTTAQPSSSSR